VNLMPRITYIKDVRSVGGRRVVFHVAFGPKPGGLYDLQPVLSGNRVTGVETLTRMQRRLLPRANVVGVNGDFFGWELGNPTGIFVRDGVLRTTPNPHRSSVGIGVDGLMRIARIGYGGTFQIGAARVRNLKQFNRNFGGHNGFSLFSRAWGERTPAARRTHELILKNLGQTFPNRDRAAELGRVVKGSRHAIPDGGAILQARGTSRALLHAEAAPGLPFTFRLGLENWWDGVEDAIGGGPLLVRGGVPVWRSDADWFTSYQLHLRHPRTAIGQRGDGRIILLVADGRSARSHGLTMNQLANAMVRYGAERAMALDGGGSSELAFNGNVLNRPSDGRERALADSIQLVYIGAYARKPKRAVFSPNGDGYRDRQRLYAKFVRRSDVHLRLFRPNGELKWEYQARREPGVITKDLGPRLSTEGAWRWVVSGTDLQGRDSSMARRFRVNNTLGFLDLSTRKMRVRRGRGGHLRIGFRQTHTADVRVVIERRGKVVRHLVSRDGLGAGAYAVVWNGKNDAGNVVRSGTFSAVVRARNSLGLIDLRKSFSVERVS
jgi:hypothetical protein